MMYLQKNTVNNFTFTATELITLTATNVYYLFRLVSCDNPQNEILFTGVDISTNIVRYNQFNIIETGSTYVDHLNSTINLTTPGYYEYFCYQMLDPTNLFLSGTTGGPLEYGKTYLSGATIDQVTEIYTGETINYVYNN